MACWGLDDVVSVLKESFSSDVGNFRSISVTSILSKVFEKIMVGKLINLLGGNSRLSPSQSLYRTGLETCHALVLLSHHLQAALNRGTEGRLAQLDFSTAFDRVSRRGLLYKLRPIGMKDSSCS